MKLPPDWDIYEFRKKFDYLSISDKRRARALFLQDLADWLRRQPRDSHGRILLGGVEVLSDIMDQAGWDMIVLLNKELEPSLEKGDSTFSPGGE